MTSNKSVMESRNEISVLVVLSNYKRPTNIPLCIKAWKGQSIPPTSLVVVDNSPRPVDEELPERYPNPLFEGATDVWRFTNNLGCPARFAPAFCLYKSDYVIFADDDLIPGQKAIEYCLEIANTLGNCFATLGQIGRIIDPTRPKGRMYINGNSGRSNTIPQVCDITCRCYMVQTKRLWPIVSFRHYLYSYVARSNLERDLLDVHDDILCCAGIQWAIGYNSYLIPDTGDLGKNLIASNLEERGIDKGVPNSKVAVWQRPGHFAERNAMIDLVIRAGWQRP